MSRYLADFDLNKIKKEYHDVTIIGSGIAGVYTALKTSEEFDIVIVTKETINISNSVLAQGGIAVSLDKEDSPELHFNDTIYAGAGLCKEDSVWTLVNEAAENIKDLCDFGVNFDRKNSKELSLTREGAHSKNRIIHTGDTTGKEVCDKLTSIVKEKNNVKIEERSFVTDLIVENGKCLGVLVYSEENKELKAIISKAVVCATGGYGQLYYNTTNPEVATGDGVAIAYRAGAELMDLEFIQFHPTVLFHPQNKSFLISEAVRGEGALLRNINGERFMHNYHELKELAPRDVVSRAIFEEMNRTSSSHVYLDITHKEKDFLMKRFPNIYKTCLEYGIDISKEYIPVAPAEHYCMGGIKTDAFGRTNIEAFYACGEVACNGIHGANRLASNSLLEGLVFGNKIGQEITSYIRNEKNDNTDINIKYNKERTPKNLNYSKMKKEVQKIMTDKVGIIRDEINLEKARTEILGYIEMLKEDFEVSIEYFEIKNILLLALLVIESAIERKESRGAHFRSDFNKPDDVNWKKNIIKKLKYTP